MIVGPLFEEPDYIDKQAWFRHWKDYPYPYHVT